MLSNTSGYMKGYSERISDYDRKKLTTNERIIIEKVAIFDEKIIDITKYEKQLDTIYHRFNDQLEMIISNGDVYINAAS